MDDYKIICCSFFIVIPKSSSSPILSSTQKLIEHPVFGDVSLFCRVQLASSGQIEVILKKSPTKPAIATIKLRISNMDYKVLIVDNWCEECKFGWLSLPYSMPHQQDFKFQIIWYGFVDDFYSPNSQMRAIVPFSENMDYCDMKIKVGDKEFPAHKMILCSQSPVFKKTLTADMKESAQNCINLTDLGVDVVNELLLFMYEKRIDKAINDDDLLLQLLKAGDVYEIPSLKNCCGMFLSNRLTRANALILWENAILYNSSILKSRAIAYIVVEREYFFSQEVFEEMGLRQPKLLFEICLMMKFFTDS